MDHHQGVFAIADSAPGRRGAPAAVHGMEFSAKRRMAQKEDRGGHEGGHHVRHQFPVAMQVLRHGDGVVQGQNPQP